MQRRDIASLFIGAAGGAFVSQPAVAQTCTPPCYPQTPAESAASVIPVNTSYPPLCVDRYGTNTTPGTTQMQNAFQAAINVAKKGGGEITFGATAPYLIKAPLDCTIPVGGNSRSFSFRGQGGSGAFTIPPSSFAPDLIFEHTGHAFDCTGTLGIFFSNMTITTSSTTYPKTCFLLARNSDARSMQVRMSNVMVIGNFSVAIRYLYGSEESVATGCQFFNRASDANARVNIFTQNNIRGLTSSFVTIASGTMSSLGYNDIACSQLMLSNGANAAVYEIENANFGKIIGGWLCCANASGGGKALIHVNTTYGMACGWLLDGVQGEAQPSAYGLFFGSEGSGSGAQWTLVNCQFPHTSASIGGGHPGATLGDLVLINVLSEGVGAGGCNFGGTLSSCFDMGFEGPIAAANMVQSNFQRANSWSQRNGEINHTMWDESAALNEKGYRLRNVSGQFVISALNDSAVVTTNALVVDRNGTSPTTWAFTGTQFNFTSIPGSYASDAVAASAGVAVGGLYRTGNALKVRIV